MGIGLEIVLIFVLVLINGLLAMSEIAMVSARKVRLRQRADAGQRGARAALALAGQPGRFLSTVQVGITLVGILAGAFGGATLAEELGALIGRVPRLAPYGEAIGIVAVVMAITYISLIVGELVPKQLALNAPEAIASAMARPLRLLSRVSAPAVSLLEGSTNLVLRALGTRPSTDPPVTDEEILHLLAQGTRAGIFERGEQAMVERVLRLGDRTVGDLATPRPQMVAVDVADPPGRQRARMAESRHSWFPVVEGTLDRVLGLVSVKDLWPHWAAGRTPELRSHLIEPLYLPETLPALRALERFRETGKPMGLVLDEYGGIEGLVTSGDVLKAIVGELAGPAGAEPMVVRREDGSWLLDGLLAAAEVAALLGVPAAEAGSLTEHQTLGGFVMGRLGRVPQAGDRFDWQGYRFEVVDMDGRRVDKVLVAPLPAVLGEPAVLSPSDEK